MIIAIIYALHKFWQIKLNKYISHLFFTLEKIRYEVKKIWKDLFQSLISVWSWNIANDIDFLQNKIDFNSLLYKKSIMAHRVIMICFFQSHQNKILPSQVISGTEQNPDWGGTIEFRTCSDNTWIDWISLWSDSTTWEEGIIVLWFCFFFSSISFTDFENSTEGSSFISFDFWDTCWIMLFALFEFQLRLSSLSPLLFHKYSIF